MKIELGEWKMRDGRKAVVLCTDAPGVESCIGYIINSDNDSVSRAWRPDGRYRLFPKESGIDLIEPWRDPVKYSVDVWLSKHPASRLESEILSNFLFGNAGWSFRKWKDCDKKYRITVEEVVE